MSKLHAPFKGFVKADHPDGSVTQWFGENVDLYSKAVCVPNQGCLQGHNGLDIVAPWGTSILAVEEGTVVEVKLNAGGYGKHVRILSSGSEWTYGHLSDIIVEIGQEVKAGEKIGNMGNTGFVVSGATPYWKFNPYAGTHLHLGKRKIRHWNGIGTYNLQYAGGEKVTILNYDNGKWGSVDFKRDLPESHNPEQIIRMLTIVSLMEKVVKLLRMIIRSKGGTPQY